MSIRTKFILYLVAIHVLLVGLSIGFLPENSTLFLVSEVLLLISVAGAVYLYRSVIQPLEVMQAGIESLKDQDFSTRFTKKGHREVDTFVDVYNQMADELRMERTRLRAQNYFLEKLIEASPSAIIILDFDGNISSLNPAAMKLPGFSDEHIVGKPVNELVGFLPEAIAEMDKEGSQLVNINGLRSYKVQKAHFMDRGFPHYFVVVEDLTEEFLITEKKAYEKVIRMMSHEVNNSIGAINSILDSVSNYHDQLETGDRKDFSEAISVAISRNLHLNQFMANFAKVVRVPPPLLSSCDLHTLLKRIVALMDGQAREREISWDWKLASESLIVELDESQIEQVLVNVLKNAMESIGHSGKIGLITTKDPPNLMIEDNGKGIPKEVVENLFSPFFSTRKDGQGIGLTLTREILINHGFHFELSTLEPGLTRFRIDF